jgi:hypothetical protein
VLTPVGFLSRHSSGLQGSKLTFSYVNSDVPYGNDAVFFFSSLHPLTAAVWPIYLCPHTVMLAHEMWSDSSFVRIKMLVSKFQKSTPFGFDLTTVDLTAEQFSATLLLGHSFQKNDILNK